MSEPKTKEVSKGTVVTPKETVSQTDAVETVTLANLADLKKQIDAMKRPALSKKAEEFVQKELPEDATRKVTKEKLGKLIDELEKIKDDSIPEHLVSVKAAWDNILNFKAEAKVNREKHAAGILELPNTKEGFEDALKKLKEWDYKGAQRYLLLSKIIEKWIYGNGYSIREDGKWFKNRDVVEEEGKKQEEFSKIFDKYVSKDDYKNAILFNAFYTNPGAIETISQKYGLDIKSAKTDKDRAYARTLVLGAKDTVGKPISEQDKMVLLAYLGGEHEEIKATAEAEVKANMGRQAENKDKIQKATGIEWTKEKAEEYARHPEKLIGDVFRNLGPIGTVSAIGFIIGKIFGFDAFGDKGNFVMKLFAIGTGVGLYQATGAGNYVADMIADKNGAQEATGDALSWALGTVTKLVKETAMKVYGTVDEAASRISMWHNFSNFATKQFDPETGKVEHRPVIESDFHETLKNLRAGNGAGLYRIDKEPFNDGAETKLLREKLEALEQKGIVAYGSKEEFLKQTKGMRIAQAIDYLTDNHPETNSAEPEKRNAPKDTKEVKQWESKDGVKSKGPNEPVSKVEKKQAPKKQFVELDF